RDRCHLHLLLLGLPFFESHPSLHFCRGHLQLTVDVDCVSVEVAVELSVLPAECQRDPLPLFHLPQHMRTERMTEAVGGKRQMAIGAEEHTQIVVVEVSRKSEQATATTGIEGGRQKYQV